MAIKLNNIVQAKSGTIARTDTTAAVLFTLPAGAMPIDIRMYTGTASDSATSATITVEYKSVDGTVTATTLGTLDAKVAGAQGVSTGAAGVMFQRISQPMHIQAKYSEVGAASTGGPFTIVVKYL